jgi:hypothetical protein
MVGRWTLSQSDHEQEIRALKDELWRTRMTVIGLMPAKMEPLLVEYHFCKDYREGAKWQRKVLDAVLSIAETNLIKHQHSSDRAICPLCNGGSQDFYATGFAFPEGLTRHLMGLGKAHQCSVMSAIVGLAYDHWNKEFGKAKSLKVSA